TSPAKVACSRSSCRGTSSPELRSHSGASRDASLTRCRRSPATHRPTRTSSYFTRSCDWAPRRPSAVFNDEKIGRPPHGRPRVLHAPHRLQRSHARLAAHRAYWSYHTTTTGSRGAQHAGACRRGRRPAMTSFDDRTIAGQLIV